MLIPLSGGRIYDTAGTLHTPREGTNPPEMIVTPVEVLRGEDALAVLRAFVEALPPRRAGTAEVVEGEPARDR